MGKTIIDAPRSTIFLVEPEKLTLITDKKHPLYDPRVELPLNDGLVRSMRAGGTFDPVLVFKDGETLVVIDGQQRQKAACEVNRQFAAEKSTQRVRLETIVKRGEPRELFALKLKANLNRQDDSDMEIARSLKRLMDFGYTATEAGAQLGFDKPKAGRYLALLDLDTKVQAAMEAGKISMTAVAPLMKFERTQQVVELDKLLAEAGGKRVRVRAVTKAVKKAKGQKASDAPSRKEIAKLWEHVKLKPAGDEAPERLRARLIIVDVLEWVLTGTGGGAFVDAFRSAPKPEAKSTKSTKSAEKGAANG